MKTIKIEIANTNVTLEKGFEAIGKVFKRKNLRFDLLSFSPYLALSLSITQSSLFSAPGFVATQIVSSANSIPSKERPGSRFC